MRTFTFSSFFFWMFILSISVSSSVAQDVDSSYVPDRDIDLVEFPLNLEYLEAEFFLWSALGYGLDVVEPGLSEGGPSPIGVTMANLDPFTKDLITQFAFQEVGHLKAIKSAVRGFARPSLDLSVTQFSNVMDKAMGRSLQPPFDPYANSLNYLIACYLIPYVGLTGYVGANSKLQGTASKKLVAGLLAVESGQDAVIRALLYERAPELVTPYGFTVAEVTNRISMRRNKLGKKGLKDEGLMVPYLQGAEGMVRGNVIAGNNFSLGYDRTPEEVLRIVYGSGDEAAPGGFFPDGGLGNIARSYLE